MSIGPRSFAWAAGLALVLVHQPAPTAFALRDQLQVLRSLDLRVASIAYRLQVSNLNICPRHARLTGLLMHDLQQYSGSYRLAARELFGLNDYPAIEAVVSEGPAAAAGVQADDKLFSVDSVAVPQEHAGGAARYDKLAEVSALIDAAAAKGRFSLELERQGKRRAVAVTPVEGCASAVQVDTVPGVHASADGEMISISQQAVLGLPNDDMLAVFLAHELAHNILRHKERQECAGIHRGIRRMFGKDAFALRAMEREADILGLYLIDRAGFEISVAPSVWRRFGRVFGDRILSDPTHPDPASRVALSQAVISDIRQARAHAREAPLPVGLVAEIASDPCAVAAGDPGPDSGKEGEQPGKARGAQRIVDE